MTSVLFQESFYMERLNLSEALRSFRRHKDLTQEAIAQKLGLKRTTYTSYEQGLAQPPRDILAKLKELGFEDEVSTPKIPASHLLIPIPYIGHVSASDKVNWTDPFEAEEMEFVPPEMGDPRGRFCCTVASDSCYDLLWPGDVAVFQRSDIPKLHMVHLFRSNDNRITIKQVLHNGQDFILHPLNPKYQDELAEGSALGYLVGIVREQGSRKVTVYDSTGIRP